ncbi:Ger(x)C family spore germination protein, partial [Clostridium perfringens]
VVYNQKQKQFDTLQMKELIEREVNDQIAGHLRKALRTSQRVGADILQLGMLVDWNYPDHRQKVRANWPDYYKNEVEIQVVTDIKIRNFGSILRMNPK